MTEQYQDDNAETQETEKFKSLSAIGKKRVLLTRFVAKVAAELHLDRKQSWCFFERTGSS